MERSVVMFCYRLMIVTVIFNSVVLIIVVLGQDPLVFCCQVILTGCVRLICTLIIIVLFRVRLLQIVRWLVKSVVSSVVRFLQLLAWNYFSILRGVVVLLLVARVTMV